MEVGDLQGMVNMPLSSVIMLMEKSKMYEQGYDKVSKALQIGLQEIVMSVARTIKAESSNVGIRVAEFSPEEIIDDIVNKDKVLHIFLTTDQKGVNIVIKTGNREA